MKRVPGLGSERIGGAGVVDGIGEEAEDMTGKDTQPSQMASAGCGRG